MFHSSFAARVYLSFLVIFFLPSVGLALPSPTLIPSDQFNAREHTMENGYTFPASDGWHSFQARGPINMTTALSPLQPFAQPSAMLLPRKYSTSKSHTKPPSDGDLGVISGTLKAVGDAIGVIITWYTGVDLENPSCWSKSVWTPTDDSHACALTLQGWSDRPRCFDFLELCNGAKCVFVRVIDTCAGCAAGSKHVDLTKSAFTALAPLDVGVLTVQMRKATVPTQWDEKLYGPGM